LIFCEVSHLYVKFPQNTPGLGAEYEVVVPAYFALKLNNTKDVQNYSIESNVENFGKFDDVVINVSAKNSQQIKFAIQLKHKDNNYKKIYPGAFEKLDGNFSLNTYYEAFKTMSDENKQCQLILYTNAQSNFKKTSIPTKFTIIEDPCDGKDIAMLFNTSSGGGNVYRFEDNNTTLNGNEDNITTSDYEDFLSRLRIFVCQKNEKDLKHDMIRILGESPAIKYIEFFRKWHQGKFTNKKIDKATVNVHLIDIFLSPFIISDRYFPVDQNDKLKLFEKVIKEFDVTLVNDAFKEFTKNLTGGFNPEEGIEEKLLSYKKNFKIEPNASLDKCIIHLAKETKIIDRSVTVLENEVKLKVLQYVFEKPLIVSFNETSEELIYKIMELHQLGSKIKFILVGQGIQSARLSRFRIFENMNHLRSNDELYSEVTRTCRLSLQGKKETTLEELINSCTEICEHVGAKEVFQMLIGKFLIGQATESLPSCYINRKISFKVEKIDAFLDRTFFDNHLAVVKFDREVKKVQNEIRKRNINVVDLHDYLKSTQISNDPMIISTNEEFSKQLLQDVFKRSYNKSVVYLRISEDNGFIIISMEENQIHCLTRPINILCADPGMGKTTMLKKLRNECDSSFWTIAVHLKIYCEFFKTKHDANELLDYLIEGNENNFSKRVRDVFRSEKKVYFFFDGLDEVEKSCVDNVLDSVEELSSEGFHVWISSRKNLKTKLEDRFEKVAMDMEEVEREQQKFYIKNRLTEEYNHEEIENLIKKMFNSFDIDSKSQVLGKVLQLYIITQNFLRDKELHQQMTKHTFVFTKIYDLFFRGRFKHNRDKEESKNPHLSLAEEEDIFEKYELVAVHSLFGEIVSEKLNLDLRRARRFLEQIKTNKDPLGIVTMVNDEGKAVFEHFTYGEYFAARFFANNFDKARLIREELFSDGRKNLMMILSVILAEDNPLHLAVIYRDVGQIAKYIEDKNVHDKAGRNPLHLATYNEPRCVGRKSCFIEASIEATEYLRNIRILKEMMKFKYTDRDKLFQWNALEYAFENQNFVAVEIILKRCEYSEDELRQYTKEYINNDKFVYFCLTHGCTKLLSSIFEISEENEAYFRRIFPANIIEHTMKNCYFQKHETLCFVIDILIHKYNFYVNSTNERGETALHLAAKYGKTYAVQILLEKGASVKVVTPNDKTPLHLARDNGHEQIVNLLTEKTPEHDLSIRKENEKRAGLCIEKQISLDDCEYNNEFRLHLAASSGNVKTVKSLIDEGDVVDAVTNLRETPLHIAAFKGNTDIAELLIEKGASVNALADDDLSPLHYAAQRGNSEIVALLMKKGASVDALADDDLTPLHRAAQSGNSETLSLLIENGASVNVLTSNNQTPLHWAAQCGNSETTELLIEKGASVNSITINNETPLHYAAQSRNSKTAELLIEKGAAVSALTTSNQTPLHWAAQSGNSETAELLIVKGASVNVVTTDNESSLHCAAQSGNSEVAELLIEKGASVNALATGDQTPLHWAAQRGNSDLTIILIDKGASVNALTTRNQTPLHWAAQSGNSEVVELLIEKGASVNALTTGNQTPLHWVSRGGNSKTTELLIKNGASVNALDIGTQTPLHWAAEGGNSKTAELLIEKGAIVNALAKDEVTPLHRAAEKGNSEIVALLIEKGASVKALATGKQTPLHWAVEGGFSKTAELLIEKGASVNALATGNQTPLHWAAEGGNSKTVELLIEKGSAVNALTTSNQTPLHLVARQGKSKTAELLIKKGASVNVLAKDEVTPLHCAAQKGSYKIAALLIEKGASVNALATSNQTPLHWAAQGGNSKTAELLIEKGAFVNAITTGNQTPLHWTAHYGNTKTAELLIEKGASVNGLATDEVTPLHCAAQKANSEIVALLIEKGASLNALDNGNETPLHWAAKGGNSKIAELLIEKGAFVNSLAKNLVTPLHWAAQKGNTEVAALLIEKGASINALTTDNQTPLHRATQSGNSDIAELIEKAASVNALANNDPTLLH
jgi:ankyrin repeat protein